MSYGLTNRVLVRKDSAKAQPQAGAPRELLNVSVRQSYYTDANASQFDTSYSYGFNNRAAERVFADLAGRARDADRRRWRSTTGSNTTRWRCRDSPKLLGMGLNGTLRTADVERRPAAGAARRSRRPRRPAR